MRFGKQVALLQTLKRREMQIGFDIKVFDRSIGEFQALRFKLADMYRDIEAGRSILYRACATANPPRRCSGRCDEVAIVEALGSDTGMISTMS